MAEDSGGATDTAVERVVAARVRECAGEWFGTKRPHTVRVRALSSRPRADLYTVYLDGAPRPRILAKVRRGSPAVRDAGDRPVLAPGPLPLGEQTACEYDGLRAAHSTFTATGDPRFDAVRPLDRLVDPDTLLMEYVEARTFRQVLGRWSRLTPTAPWTGRDGGPPWSPVGAWLRRFHEAVPVEGRPRRQATRDEVVERFLAYDAYLTARLGPRGSGSLGGEGAELAAGVLPERLPLVVGHGDFAPRNALVDPVGRLVVLDPLPRWAVPPFEDVGRFLVGVRLLGLQLHSHGAAFSPRQLRTCEQAVVGGYYGGDPVPWPALHCYQLLIMLDKWAALLASGSTGARGRVRRASLVAAGSYVRRQGTELLALARDESPSVSWV